jgi:small multidrug resistance pump
MNPWIFLSLAIIAEVIATTSLKASENFTRPGPTALVVVGYAIAFYFLSLTLKSLPIGIAYAVWSGVGIALITLIAWKLYGQTLDGPGLLGIGLIIAGVIVINLFSKATAHG